MICDRVLINMGQTSVFLKWNFVILLVWKWINLMVLFGVNSKYNNIINIFTSQHLQVRWRESAADIEKKRKLLVGDVFLCAACVSYYGAFSGPYRAILVANWIKRAIVYTH